MHDGRVLRKDLECRFHVGWSSWPRLCYRVCYPQPTRLTNSSSNWQQRRWTSFLRFSPLQQRAWGDDFDLKEYHDAILSYGSPPTQYARALVLDEQIPRLTENEGISAP